MNSGSLPAAALPAPPSDPWLERNLKHVSILVVDDEMGIRNFVVKLLAPLCKKVEEAKSAEEASKLLDTQQDRKSTRLNSSHSSVSRMPSSA